MNHLLDWYLLKGLANVYTVVQCHSKSTPLRRRYGAKFACARPRTTFATFAIYCATHHDQKSRFRSWWYHSVRMGKALQGVMILLYYSKSPTFGMSKKAWVPIIGFDSDVTEIVLTLEGS